MKALIRLLGGVPKADYDAQVKNTASLRELLETRDKTISTLRGELVSANNELVGAAEKAVDLQRAVDTLTDAIAAAVANGKVSVTDLTAAGDAVPDLLPESDSPILAEAIADEMFPVNGGSLPPAFSQDKPTPLTENTVLASLSESDPELITAAAALPISEGAKVKRTRKTTAAPKIEKVSAKEGKAMEAEADRQIAAKVEKTSKKSRAKKA